jgi:hypothetical protein
MPIPAPSASVAYRSPRFFLFGFSYKTRNICFFYLYNLIFFSSSQW